jgi:hypothetical protein
LLNFFTMTEFWDKPAEKSGKVLAAFLEGLPLVPEIQKKYPWWMNRGSVYGTRGTKKVRSTNSRRSADC